MLIMLWPGLEQLSAKGTENLGVVLRRSKKLQTKNAKQVFMYEEQNGSTTNTTRELDFNVSLNGHGIVDGDVIELTSECRK